MKIKKYVSAPETQRKIKRSYLTVATVAAAVIVMALPVYADDPLATINALSDFVFSAIKAIGAILLGFGIVQIGLALKSHDAGQRAQGFMTFFGGVVIYFAKDILDMILWKKPCGTCACSHSVIQLIQTGGVRYDANFRPPIA